MSRQKYGEAADDHAAIHDDRDTHQPLLVARGTGGRLVLWEDQVWLIKFNLFGGVINLLGFDLGKINKSINIIQISAVTIVQPMFFPNYITFTYPGCPVSTGNMMQDAFAENALLMNFFDNRRFFELKQRMDSLRRAHHRGERTS